MTRPGAWYRRHVWSASVALVVVVLVAGFLVLQVVMRDRIGDGVAVAGVSLQGLSEGDARDRLRSELERRLSTVQLQAGERPIRLSLAELGMRLDVQATAATAMRRGRHELPFGLAIWLPGGGGEVRPVLRLDAAAYETGLDGVRKLVDVKPRDARLAVGHGRVMVVPGKDGRTVDAVGLKRMIEAASEAGRAYAGEVPTVVVHPRVGTAEAESRAGVAALYLARPVTLRYRSRTDTLSPARVADMLTVNTGADAAVRPLTFRNPRARSILHRLFAGVERSPVDARLVVDSKGGVSITPSRDGQILDMPTLLDDLDKAAAGRGLRTVVVALKPALPKLTSEEARSNGLASMGTQFTTYFDPRNKARARNIALAAKLVDGAMVPSGQTFSLNAAMGPRTANRGFDYAPVIAADGVLRQGVGGGICQYATTLFNAVFFAGLPVVERHPHSLYISHYPIGRDATVAWGSLDFKFRNDMAKTLLIRSWVSGNALFVAIVGKTSRDVTFATSPFYDIHRPSHTKARPRVIYDDDLGGGVVRWERGVDGRSVKVERTVRSSDGALLFRDTFISRYQAMDWVKRVGT